MRGRNANAQEQLSMSVANGVEGGRPAAGQQAGAKRKDDGPAWWEHPALFRYGFVALILIVPQKPASKAH